MQLQQFSLILIGILVLIILYSIIGNLFEHKHFHAIHQTGVGILIGAVFGTVLFFLNDITKINFDEQVFFYGLLPPMIFAGGYNLKKKDFGKNFKYILIFGLVGTITTFGLICGLTFFINQMHWIIPERSQSNIQHLDATLIVKYSATISATDSVAALTLIKATEYPKLFSIIFGEGMVNDAVAIILYKVVGGIMDDFDHQKGQSVTGMIGKIVGSFTSTVFFSIMIGALSAILCSYLFKVCHYLTQSQVTQVVLSYLFGIWSYVIAQYFDLSGVITVLISGIVLAHYNFYNLTVGGMHATAITFQSVSFIAQAIVFVYLGLSTISYLTTQVLSLSFLGLQLFICVFSRFLTVFLLSFLFSLIYKRKWALTARQLSVISFAGSIRGSVAFALILTIESNEKNADQVSVIKSTTLIMVCFTTIIFGAVMPKVIHFLLGNNSPALSFQDQQASDKENLSLIQQKSVKKAGFFKYSDENYWRPFLIHKYVQRRQQIHLYKNLMKFNSRGEYQGGNFNALVTMQARKTLIDDFIENIQKKDTKKSDKQSKAHKTSQ